MMVFDVYGEYANGCPVIVRSFTATTADQAKAEALAYGDIVRVTDVKETEVKPLV